MKVRVIRQFLNGRELVNEGRELDVTERRAEQLMNRRQPLVVPIAVGERERTRRAIRQSDAAHPTESTETIEEPPTGGPTGEATPRSSSRRGRPPRSRQSSEDED